MRPCPATHPVDGSPCLAARAGHRGAHRSERGHWHSAETSETLREAFEVGVSAGRVQSWFNPYAAAGAAEEWSRGYEAGERERSAA